MSLGVTGQRAAIAVLIVATLLLAGGEHAAAQTPPGTPNEAQALAVERQLVCPVCVNERLDVCNTAVCVDMKRVIRERLAAGATPDEILLHFETRYGQSVRADLPREGFNLLLFGWVGGVLVLMATAATLVLTSMRRASLWRTEAMRALDTSPDDRWLDAQLHEDKAASTPPPG